MKLATLCYLKKNNKTLMLHRVKKENDTHAGKWNGLGGKFEPGEAPEDCVVREIWEESGLRIKKLELKGVLTFPGFAHGEDWYVFVFISRAFSGKIKSSEEGNLKWIKDSELVNLNLWDGDRIFLKYLDKKAFFSGVFHYKNSKVLSHKMYIYKK